MNKIYLKTKYEFETRNYNPSNSPNTKTTFYPTSKTLEEATKLCRFHAQCTYEESQTSPKGYSHIIEYRDDEHHNDLYFI